MIIDCINCNKKFNVDQNLIPKNGRKIQCGSCDHTWHYKNEKLTSETFVNDEQNDHQKKIFENNQSDSFENKLNDEAEKITGKDKSIKKFENEKVIESEKEIKTSVLSNFFSYLIVFIISILALIILIDTIKSPLIDIFPGLEIVLFSLFETLKDIKLFIIDLN